MPRRAKTHRKQKGGRRIGGGTYGVAFRPALPCVGTGRTPDSVAKVVSDETQADEWRRGRIVHNIRGIDRFIAYPTSQCILDQVALIPANGFVQANMVNFRDARGQFPMLLSSDGGDSFFDIRLTGDQYIPFLESLPNVFQGLWILHLNHVVHRDIKPQNLVTRRLANGQFESKILDVGLLVYSNQVVEAGPEDIAHNQLSVFNPEMNLIYSEPTSYMPFDLTLMYNGDGYQRYDDIPFSLNINRYRYQTWVEDQTYYFATLPYQKFDERRQSLVPDPPFNDLIVTLNAPGGLYRRHSPQDIEQIFFAADIWMLGLTMLYLWTKMTYQAVIKVTDLAGVSSNTVFMMKNKFAAELGGDQIGVNDLENLLFNENQVGLIPQETIDWYVTIANDITIPWHEICMAMMHPDPAQRIDLVTAAGRFDALLPVIRNHFSVPNFQQHLIALRIQRPGAVAAVAAAGGGAAAAGGGGAAAAGGGGGGGRMATPAHFGGQRKQKTRRTRK
jgi:serine/threonine protein kinase